MAGGQGAFDTGGPLTDATIEGTEVSPEGIVLAAVRVSEDDTGAREAVYGALGVGGRPLPLDKNGAAAEAICARLASGDLPVLASRDLRIEAALEALAEGTIYAAGYYGARLRFDVVNGEARSVVSLSDGAGRELVLDDQGVRVPSSPLIQGDPGAAQDVALAEPLVTALLAIDASNLSVSAALSALAAIPSLSPAAAALGAAVTALGSAHTALAPYLAPGSPQAPTTRAPDLRGAPGA